MPKRSIIEAIDQQPPAPCDDPCPKRGLCFRRRMACHAYHQYINRGWKADTSIRLPSKEWLRQSDREDLNGGSRLSGARVEALRVAGLTPRVLEAAINKGAVDTLVHAIGCPREDLVLAARRWGLGPLRQAE